MPEPKTSQRSQIVLLAVLLVALAGALLYSFRPAASPAAPPSNLQRDGRQPAAGAPKAEDLQVRLDTLEGQPPAPGTDGRNPFRFYVPPPPPPPPRAPVQPAVPAPRPKAPGEEGYVPPPPPPIPLKFIGTAEQGKKKVAIFTDGKGLPVYASEGEMVLGQYRLVRIQLESVVMEYADGRGRQTIPMRGQ